MTDKPVINSKLHHNAHVTTDMEAVRKFYEEIIGFPLVASEGRAHAPPYGPGAARRRGRRTRSTQPAEHESG